MMCFNRKPDPAKKYRWYGNEKTAEERKLVEEVVAAALVLPPEKWERDPEHISEPLPNDAYAATTNGGAGLVVTDFTPIHYGSAWGRYKLFLDGQELAYLQCQNGDRKILSGYQGIAVLSNYVDGIVRPKEDEKKRLALEAKEAEAKKKRIEDIRRRL